MTILIVDSSIQITDRLERLVSEAYSKLQMDKAIAFGGALRLFKVLKQQLILLDMHLPENKSFDLLTVITATGKTYIIAWSIQGRLNVREQCKQQGADLLSSKIKRV